MRTDFEGEGDMESVDVDSRARRDRIRGQAQAACFPGASYRAPSICFLRTDPVFSGSERSGSDLSPMYFAKPSCSGSRCFSSDTDDGAWWSASTSRRAARNGDENASCCAYMRRE